MNPHLAASLARVTFSVVSGPHVLVAWSNLHVYSQVRKSEATLHYFMTPLASEISTLPSLFLLVCSVLLGVFCTLRYHAVHIF